MLFSLPLHLILAAYAVARSVPRMLRKCQVLFSLLTRPKHFGLTPRVVTP